MQISFIFAILEAGSDTPGTGVGIHQATSLIMDRRRFKAILHKKLHMIGWLVIRINRREFHLI
jgi:hypothetical protein